MPPFCCCAPFFVSNVLPVSGERNVLAVDVGGTFTDAVVTGPGGTFTGKSPTTPDDQSRGVLAAAAIALDAAGLEHGAVDEFIHGMTVTTNALLERKLARTALLATRGFTDIEELGRQNRADLYRLCAARAPAIAPPELRFAINERCGPDGVIEPLDETSVREALQECLAAGVQSIAVCLLFSFRHSAHELRIAELAEELAPGLHVSLSHRTVGTFREYERCATTVADAALSPLLSGYLDRLAGSAADSDLPAPSIMLSNGGSASAEFAGQNASWTVLSGPAGGAAGARAIARRHGEARVLAFDMGGTSTDIAVVENGEVRTAAAREIGGLPIALPAIDISTVGAGGGSIAWRDAGGSLRVGPQSAGARPGPACYGHGGRLPTVTDANLLLGHLTADSSLAGGLKLDAAAAERAVDELAAELGLDRMQTAAGIIEIANLEMLRAMTAATVARGVDPRDHTLVAFGGAGPMHAAAIADALEIDRVICPAAGGVLSAWGMAHSGRRLDNSRSLVVPLEAVSGQQHARLVDELAAPALAELGAQATVSVTNELRYAGQAFELPVTADFGELARAFHEAHMTNYGFNEPSVPIELVTVRVAVSTAAPSPGDTASERAHERHGPLVLELPETTIVVPADWTARVEHGDHVLTREERR